MSYMATSIDMFRTWIFTVEAAAPGCRSVYEVEFVANHGCAAAPRVGEALVQWEKRNREKCEQIAKRSSYDQWNMHYTSDAVIGARLKNPWDGTTRCDYEVTDDK